MKTKTIALALGAAFLAAIPVSTFAVVKYESDQCRGATRMSYAALLEFHESVEDLHSIARRAENAGFMGALYYGRDLMDARAVMDEKHEEAASRLSTQIGVCDPMNSTERFAASINPGAFSVKNETEWYQEILDLHNNKRWSW